MGRINKNSRTIFYSFIIVLLAIVIFAGSFMYKRVTAEKHKQETIESAADKQEQSIVKESETKGKAEEEEKSVTGFLPGFKKTELSKEAEEQFSTPWRISPGKKLSACIEGRGQNGREEGIGKIYIKNLSSEAKWELELNNDEKQNTPMYIDWWDDDYLMVVIGYGYGTLSPGGSLYAVNVNTGKVVEICVYRTPDQKIDNKQQILNAKRSENDILFKVLVYEDANYNNFHTEDRKVTDWNKEFSTIK